MFQDHAVLGPDQPLRIVIVAAALAMCALLVLAARRLRGLAEPSRTRWIAKNAAIGACASALTATLFLLERFTVGEFAPPGWPFFAFLMVPPLAASVAVYRSAFAAPLLLFPGILLLAIADMLGRLDFAAWRN